MDAVQRRATVRLCVTVAVGIAMRTAAANDAVPLRSIGELLALPPTEHASDRPVRIRGVVTMAVGNTVVQDETAAMYVSLEPEARDQAERFRLGDVVNVEGAVRPSQYAPILAARRLSVVASGSLPEPTPGDLGRLFAGADNGLRVVLSGVVQEVLDRERSDTWPIVVGCMSRRIIAILPQRLFPERPDALVDAAVNVTGVVGAFRNDRGEFIAPIVTVVRKEDLVVAAPAPETPFASDLLPLDSIAGFRRQPARGHRLRTEGVVSFVLERSLWLERGEAGVRVDLATGESAAGLQPGDRAEVAGFLDMSRRIGGLVGTVVRKVGAESPPVPMVIRPADLAAEAGPRSPLRGPRGSHDGRLVRCTARVLGTLESSDQTVLSLIDRGTTLDAVLPAAGDRQPTRIDPGTEVAVTGILQLDLAAPGTGDRIALNPPLERLSVLVRGPEDIAVIRPAPWWTPARLAAVLGVVAAVLGGTLLWVWGLRRQVRAQARQLAVEMQSRRDSSLEFEATLRERNRLAANLHDTLLQTLGGIGYQLDACEGSRDRDADEARTHFDVARRMVNHASMELHNSVWAMRTLPVRDQTFPEALRCLVQRVGEGHTAAIDVDATGPFDDVPEFVAGNVLLIVQEAVVNALRHGRPRRITVRVADRVPQQSIEVVVHDDGRGFDQAGCQGFADGHFGIQGMRERAGRLGGSVAIESRVGGGTTVRATVRRHEFDAHLAAGRPDP